MHVTDNVFKFVQLIFTWWYKIIQNGSTERISNLDMFLCFVLLIFDTNQHIRKENCSCEVELFSLR